MTYFNDLKSFYRVLSPADLFGKVSVRDKPDGYGSNSSVADFSYEIFRTYIEKAINGESIITMGKNINVPNSPDKGVGRGYLYNTLHQKLNGGAQYVLEPEYWQWVDPIDDSTKPTPTTRPVTNFYKEVCGASSEPPTDLTINVLRTPKLNPNGRNVGEVELFLNSMPTMFASQLVPYFEVEFQLPQVPDETDKVRYLNRPSLLRFLLGSEVDRQKLSESAADRSLVAAIRNPGKNSAKGPLQNNFFVGMEMFTSPQTLTNMDTLNPTNSVSRPQSVMPFYPPATLMGASVKQIGAGAGTFARTTADLEFKVHDRARLAEFSEFLRGPPGYQNVTVWLTYGWLAPRGRGDDDAYAKFINNNMLVKRAFGVKNSGFSFDTQGQCNIKVELVSKNVLTLENESIVSVADDNDLKKAFKELEKVAPVAKEVRKLIGNSIGDGFSKEIRIFQVLDSAAAGEMFIDIPYGEVANSVDSMKKAIQKNNVLPPNDQQYALDALEAIKRFYDAPEQMKLRGAYKNYFKDKFEACRLARSADPFIPVDAAQKKMASSNKEFFTKDFVAATYERGTAPDPNSKTPEPPDPRGELVANFVGPVTKNNPTRYKWFWYNPKKKPTNTPLTPQEIKEFELDDIKGEEFANAQKKKAAARKAAKPKPAKSRIAGRFYLKRWRSRGIKGRLVKGTKASPPKQAPPPPNPKRDIVSFGKLFSSFCLPALLKSAKDDGIAEVQVNFYQLNESCGPASLHSIAEFPVDINMFMEQFTEYAIRRGGDTVTMKDFVEFCTENIFGDNRSPGYGMRSFYVAYSSNKKELTPSSEESYQSNMSAWATKYREFKRPHIVITSEVLYEDEGVKSNVDLLSQLSSIVGPSYKGPQQLKKLIKRIHIIDTTLDQYSNLRKEIMTTKDDDGRVAYTVLDKTQNEEVKKELSRHMTVPELLKDGVNVPDVKVIGTGRDVLRDFLGFTIPTIVYGAQGTTITNMSLSSKMDGALATATLLGGSYKASSGLMPNGLGMEMNNLPVRFVPAQLTMNSLGCPLAELYQSYFFDFGTGTTIDNVYSCNQITHTFAPGKFDTSWGLLYLDGYGRFYNSTVTSFKKIRDELTNPPASPGSSATNSSDPSAPGGK